MPLTKSITLENEQRDGGDMLTIVRNANGSVTFTVEATDDDFHSFVASAEEAKEIMTYVGSGPSGREAKRA